MALSAVFGTCNGKVVVEAGIRRQAEQMLLGLNPDDEGFPLPFSDGWLPSLFWRVNPRPSRLSTQCACAILRIGHQQYLTVAGSAVELPMSVGQW